MKRLTLVLLVAGSLAWCAPAEAVRMKTAHRMAERWAVNPYYVAHSMTCWRKGPAVKCRIHYPRVEGPVEFQESDGSWQPAYVSLTEVVTIRRRGYFFVLTSNVLTGRLTQRAGRPPVLPIGTRAP